MTGQHTEGPWFVIGEDSQDGIPFIEVASHEDAHPDYKQICFVQPNGVDDDGNLVLTDEDRANARLIASTETLLAQRDALAEALRPFVMEGFSLDDVRKRTDPATLRNINAARAALATLEDKK